MRGAIRLTAKIERSLKKLEREFTRPIGVSEVFSRRKSPETDAQRADFRRRQEWEIFKRDLANNDNASDVAPRPPVIPVKAPPVVVDKKESKSAPPVRPNRRDERIAALTPLPASAPGKERAAPGRKHAVVMMSVLAAGAFLSSFLIVYYLV